MVIHRRQGGSSIYRIQDMDRTPAGTTRAPIDTDEASIYTEYRWSLYRCRQNTDTDKIQIQTKYRFAWAMKKVPAI